MELVFMSVLFAVVGLVMCAGTTSAVENEPPQVVRSLAIEDNRHKEGVRSTCCYRGGEAWP